jgi:peptidoglycan/LPS O-acetylase OafA/YrhL
MKYYEKIDGLRFVAIFFVLIEHFATIIGSHMSAGYYGVNLFFVISGFLITSILLKPNEKTFGVNYKNFIGRRTLRIFPIYYLTILILWLVHLDIVREKLIWFLTYTFNYAWIIYNLPITPVSHFWSLGVEEQFYLFWPLIVLTLKRKHKLLTIVILAIIVIGYCQQIFNIFPSLSPYNGYGLLTNASSLGLGALGAVLSIQHALSDRLFKNKIFECLMFLILISSLVLSYELKYVVLGLCSFYLVVKAAKYDFYVKPINQLLKNKQIVHIGTLSYGIYVYHVPISHYFTLYIFNPIWTNIDFNALGRFGKVQWHSWIIKFPLYSLLSYWVASFSYKYIETPILKLKDRFFKY